MSPEAKSDPDPDHTDRIDRAVAELGEFFDTVQIFVTCAPRMKDGAMKGGSFCRFKGHWSARFGQVNEWLIYEDEKIRHYARQVSEQSDSDP